MDYSKLSDVEINVKIAKALGFSVVYLDFDPAKPMISFISDSRGNTSLFEVSDYCNSPADAWPIIMENGIEIVWSDDTCDCAGTCFKYSHGLIDSCLDFHDKSQALRAAMIVFLMSKESD